MKISDQIITATSDAMVIECDQRYLSSLGADFHQNFNMVVNSMSATAQSGSETQIRSLHGGRGNCQ